MAFISVDNGDGIVSQIDVANVHVKLLLSTLSYNSNCWHWGFGNESFAQEYGAAIQSNLKKCSFVISWFVFSSQLPWIQNFLLHYSSINFYAWTKWKFSIIIINLSLYACVTSHVCLLLLKIFSYVTSGSAFYEEFAKPLEMKLVRRFSLWCVKLVD